jgi:hypothetical protein
MPANRRIVACPGYDGWHMLEQDMVLTAEPGAAGAVLAAPGS